jgi:hypothetical protein
MDHRKSFYMRSSPVSVLQVKAPLAPPGNHLTRLDRVETRRRKYGAEERWSDSLAFVFAVTEGPHSGKEVVKTTGTDPRLGSLLGDLLADLLGRPLDKDEAIDTDSLVGRRYQVLATPGNGAGAVIARITPVKDN